MPYTFQSLADPQPPAEAKAVEAGWFSENWKWLAALAAVGGVAYYLRRRSSALNGLLIRADGTEQVLKPRGKKFALDELQKAVGGYIELVPVRLPGRKKMWVDEEGLFKGSPMNVKATQIATENGFPGPLVGDVLITEPGE